MNQTSHKYYVYSLNGLLINRVYFQEETNKFGSIIATSSNGQYYVFKKHLKDLDGNQGKPQKLEEFMRIHLLKLTIFGFKYIKKIDILDSMVGCDPKYKDEIGKDMTKLKIDVMVNDECDICVKITRRM